VLAETEETTRGEEPVVGSGFAARIVESVRRVVCSELPSRAQLIVLKKLRLGVRLKFMFWFVAGAQRCGSS
jgi:hypothetical protein